MKNSFSESYKNAGVDVTAGYKAVELMKEHVKRTKTSGVVSGIGGFGGLFAPDMKGMEEPILVSGTDGVGTKLKLASYLISTIQSVLMQLQCALMMLYVVVQSQCFS